MISLNSLFEIVTIAFKFCTGNLSVRKKAGELSRELIQKKYFQVLLSHGKEIPSLNDLKMEIEYISLINNLKIDYLYTEEQIIKGIVILVSNEKYLPDKKNIIKMLKNEVEVQNK